MKVNGTGIAQQLLQIKAIKLEPANPFLWSSGWRSPIYCDNRLILSFPEVRTLVRDEFSRLTAELYPDASLVAGVATGAIAHGVLVAEALGLPFAYVRPEPKGHGLANRIEGRVSEDDRVVVIEDLVSTGRSSLSAVEALRSAGCHVEGMLAIFTYGFAEAEHSFRQMQCELHSLTNYTALIETARTMDLVSDNQLATLEQWRIDPAGWGIQNQ
ncbi:MAG: orotate phosphoribosyltransferase [Marinilabiliales bacterium]|nr:MAG: orotate phosphoribosyltransferase [Marinilabiliales bacterium]